MNQRALDPRSVCNRILDLAEVGLSNLALQKLLYFAHGLCLTRYNRRLVSGYFEAWQYGPVHPTAYSAFKGAGAEVIDFRATGIDPLTGEKRSIPNPQDPIAEAVIKRVVFDLGSLDPFLLVRLSHADKSPWKVVVDRGTEGVAFGLRISDELIKDRFKHHKLAVGERREAADTGEPSEDAPFNSEFGSG